jgi:hypothetical protein
MFYDALGDLTPRPPWFDFLIRPNVRPIHSKAKDNRIKKPLNNPYQALVATRGGH